tara:strand:+ start:436 stop:3258 length:2823 start_codon:yes stop_codon:yes gene_type:complete
MELSGETLKTLENYVLMCKDDSELELEMVLTNRPDKEGFKSIYDYMIRTAEFELVPETDRDTMDVVFVNDSNARATIRGTAAIEEYCETNILPRCSMMQKSRIKNAPKVVVHDYDIAFRISREMEFSEDQKRAMLENNTKKQKLFRKKRRYSFLYPEFPALRIDLTQVKQSRTESRSVLQSKVLKSAEWYEIEIELDNSTPLSESVLTNSPRQMFNLMNLIIKVITKSAKTLSKSKTLQVISNYLAIVNSKNFSDLADRIERDPKSLFLTYQPVTLEQTNLMITNRLGVTNVLQDYTVTEKADGERALIFVDSDERVYMLNNRMLLRELIASAPGMANTLLDAEFIHKDKFGEILNMLAVFDIYFLQGNDVRSNQLVPDRLNMMKTATESIKMKHIKLRPKTFLHGLPLEKMFQKAYIETQYEYHVDGIILTPTNLAVGAFYKNRPHTKNTFGGTWKKTFKWKPPEENSVDMLVTFHERSFVEEIGYCMVATLKVGTQVGKDNDVEPFEVLNNTFKPKGGVTSRRFGVANLLLKTKDGLPHAINDDVIYNNTVVEFRYDGKNWIPLRVRTDKTALYARTKCIAGAANMYTTAMNVWRSIHQPVTKDILENPALIEDVPQDSDADVYYARAVARNVSLMFPMNMFHNQSIKTRLFRAMRRVGGPRLVEIACGKGGDMQKWTDSKFSTVIGIDSSLDNILNGNDGAYKRLHQLKIEPKNRSKVPDTIFLQKDMKESWDSLREINHEGLRSLYNICRGNVNKEDIEHSAVRKFYNSLNNSADVVSCQFAIHYFFCSQENLTTFCENLGRLMKPGGYFIGTCMDGEIVEKQLQVSNGLLEGVIDDNLVWRIKRLYDPNDSERIGRRISVFLETINQTIEECIVDMDVLQQELAKHNIIPLTSAELTAVNLPNHSFRDWYDDKLSLHPALKEFSFMNRWFLFKKM